MSTKLQILAKKYQLELLILFGSQKKNITHRESDVDLAYSRKKKLTLAQELKLIAELSKIFGKDVDLVNVAKASPLLLNELSDGKLLYGIKTKFDAFKILAKKQFLDFEPYFRLREKNLNKTFS